MPDIASLLDALRAQGNALGENLTAKGVPAAGNEGFAILAEKVKRINQSIANGEKETVRVSAAGSVKSGDFVSFVDELSPVAELPAEAGNAVGSAFLGGRRIAVAFVRGESLYLKAIGQDEDGSLVLGNSVLLTAVSPEITEVVGFQDAAAVFYIDTDGAGHAALMTFDGLTGTLQYTDVVDVDGPISLSACAVENRKALLCSAYSGSQDAAVRMVSFGESSLALGAECVIGLDFEPDGYTQGWSMAALSPSLAVMGCFKSHEEPLQRVLLSINSNAIRPIDMGTFITEGSMPCVSCAALAADCGGVASAVTRLGTPNETVLTFEGWYTAAEFGMQPLFWGAEDRSEGTNISRVYADMCGEDYALLSCVLDGTLHATLVGLNGNRPEGCPTVPLGEADGYARLHAINGTYVLGVAERTNGIYGLLLKRIRTVVRTEAGDGVDALASGDAKAGEAVTVYSAD